MKVKVYLRADGNSEIGMGHVVRTLALGSMISDVFDCTLYTSYPNPYISEECQKVNVSLESLDPNNHFSEFVERLSGNEIIVLDNYYFDTNYQEEIKNKGCKVVSIDDLHHNHFVSDLVLNHAPSARENDYCVENYTKLLLGLDYVLLRKKILERAKEINRQCNNRKGESLFICFGGSDHKNLTTKYLKQFRKLYQDMPTNVVVGKSYLYWDELDKLIENDPKTSIYKAVDEEKMIQLIEECKFAILPASGILFETLALRRPFISGYYADNQIENSKYFEQYDFCKIVGNLSDYTLSMKDIIFFQQNDKSYFDLIDGYSGDRVNAEFLKLIEE